MTVMTGGTRMARVTRVTSMTRVTKKPRMTRVTWTTRTPDLIGKLSHDDIGRLLVISSTDVIRMNRLNDRGDWDNCYNNY